MLKKNIYQGLLLFWISGIVLGVQSECDDSGINVFCGDNPPKGCIWLDSLENLQYTRQGGRSAQVGKSHMGNPIRVGGIEFSHGVGVHSISTMDIDLGGEALRFVTIVGIDDETNGKGSVVFEIWVDQEKKAETGVIRGGDKAQKLDVDLAGAQRLTLKVTHDGAYFHDHADWAGAFIELKPDCKHRPKIVLPSAPEPAMPIASGVEPAPSVNWPRIVGTTPGRPFLFRIPAGGAKPLRFTAENLPDGLTLDKENGIIRGSIPQPGTYSVQVEAANALGQDKQKLTLVAGEHQLALTPPMGWNSWNILGLNVTANDVKKAADLLVQTGLAEHGYSYITIDDGWEAGRDVNGYIQSNEKFPELKALADYLHDKGLKLGIYSSPGPTTCGGYEGSYGHEKEDAEQWAKWGIDYLKYDWCSYSRLITKRDRDAYMQPYLLMYSYLMECDRDIVYSLCQYGQKDVWQWGQEVGGNLWRTWIDSKDSWDVIAAAGFDENGPAKYAGPGHWNDPDMLVVGWVGWGEEPHPSRLFPNEQITHITLWCLQAAPLMLGCDLTKLDQFTLDLLTNDEVLGVDQDPLGIQADRIVKEGELEIWARPLYDGAHAVGLFNRSSKRQSMTLKFSDLKRSGPQPVRDLWQRKDLGLFEGAFTTEVPIHGVVMIKIGAPEKGDD